MPPPVVRQGIFLSRGLEHLSRALGVETGCEPPDRFAPASTPE